MKSPILLFAVFLSGPTASRLAAQSLPFPDARFRLPQGLEGRLDGPFWLKTPLDSLFRFRSAALRGTLVNLCPMPIAPVDTTVDRRMAVAVSDSTVPVRMPAMKSQCINPLGPKPKAP